MAMTPTTIEAAARDLYNGTNDPFFSSLQIQNWIWRAQQELAQRAYLIQNVYSSTTVAAQQTYTYPTQALAIRRVTVNGRKIKKITHRDDDAITLSNAAVVTQGWPIYYTVYNQTLYLRPIPDASTYALQIFTYDDASPVTATSVIQVPSNFHFDIVDYVLFRMFNKDKNTDMATFHKQLWQEAVLRAIAYHNKEKRSDSFATVQSEDTLPVTILGEA